MNNEAPTNKQSQSQQSGDPGSARNNIKWFLLIPTVLCISGVITFFLRAQDGKRLITTTHALEVESVAVIHPQPGAPETDLALPANLHAYSDSPVYARTSGYVSHWYADIGTGLNTEGAA
jgi:hypothetical protein